MDYFSESFFIEEARKRPILEQRTFSAEDKKAPLSKVFDIFLSYNIANQVAVIAIYHVLRAKGLSVYLDCIVDPDLDRNDTTKKTAQLLRTRLEHSKSLLYAQSPSAGQSNWMPWELGVVDGHTHKCLIMPVTSDAKQVTPRREYLSLYPYVKPDSYNIMKIFSEGSEARPITTDFVQYIKGL